mmetsp:Transcript_27368/g.47651  ORF Transcript_27368/g.47651 Transcript_27368/m.47651 type:complete len:102 (-) Transcript_27368:1293-1598(-)
MGEGAAQELGIGHRSESLKKSKEEEDQYLVGNSQYSKIAQEEELQLLKFAASKLAARWAALNGLSADDALQACTPGNSSAAQVGPHGPARQCTGQDRMRTR